MFYNLDELQINYKLTFGIAKITVTFSSYIIFYTLLLHTTCSLRSHGNSPSQLIWTEFGHHHISSRDTLLHRLMHCWIGSLFTFDWKHAGKNARKPYWLVIEWFVALILVNEYVFPPCQRRTCHQCQLDLKNGGFGKEILKSGWGIASYHRICRNVSVVLLNTNGLQQEESMKKPYFFHYLWIFVEKFNITCVFLLCAVYVSLPWLDAAYVPMQN